jgi:hypothetical protein
MRVKGLLLAIALLAGCTNAVHPSPPTETLEGTLVSDFEQSEFKACSGTVYWVASSGPAYELAKEAAAKDRTLRITAVVSPEGEYGHLGGYTQEILIKSAEIGTRTSDCGNP